MKELKVCLFSDTLCDANGVSRFIQDMAKEALNRECKFYVITSTAKTYCDNLENIYNIKPLIKMPMPFYPELHLVFPKFYSLKKLAKEINPDIIHVSTPGPVGISGVKIAKELNKPLAGVYHTNFSAYIKDNTKSEKLKIVTDFLMKRFYKDFSTVFTRSKEYIPILTEDIKVDKEKIITLPAGINLDRFSANKRDLSIWDKYGIDRDSKKLLYVGRLSNEKNYPFLLKVWERLSNEVENISLIVVGEGKYAKESIKYKNLHYLGYQDKDELAIIYPSSDIFLFPSVTDTLGQVVMEAQSSGVASIVSREGGPKSIVKDNVSGYTLDIKLNLWVEKIKILLTNEELREKFGSEAIKGMNKKSISSSFDKFWKSHLKLKNRTIMNDFYELKKRVK